MPPSREQRRLSGPDREQPKAQEEGVVARVADSHLALSQHLCTPPGLRPGPGAARGGCYARLGSTPCTVSRLRRSRPGRISSRLRRRCMPTSGVLYQTLRGPKKSLRKRLLCLRGTVPAPFSFVFRPLRTTGRSTDGAALPGRSADHAACLADPPSSAYEEIFFPLRRRGFAVGLLASRAQSPAAGLSRARSALTGR